ncbi:DNA primase [Candidatus Woesearchaeota archaeon]|nr:hypothetical protein [uncultured archaeon]AQS33999.1 hypothetical protein [uncultured archaeon]MBS3150282.1 DNA primase [Candidatus Woesearchaeota archaeon]
MGKISPVSAKYTIHTLISIEGIVDKPDVIGAIFGQTEGLLGSELELRELQRSGRIGRIEVNLNTKSGKTTGEIILPSSLDKAETAVIGAAMETIERIGPCDSKVVVDSIEDVRISKRLQIIDRAKSLLSDLKSKVLPDSQDITDQVAQSVRMMEVIEYGKERLAAGPNIDDSEEIIVVEGRADVLNLLKHGIKNVIALNGTSIPETIKYLGTKKVLTLFVDGDRGGDLIIRGLLDAGVEIDYVIKAPDGKEVEEITKKEIHKALRSKVAVEQIKMEVARLTQDPRRNFAKKPQIIQQRPRYINNKPSGFSTRVNPEVMVNPEESKKFKELLDDLVGTRAAYLLDTSLSILGKIPISEIFNSISNIKETYAIIFDGVIDKNFVSNLEKSDIKYLVGMDSRINPRETRITVLSQKDLR